jgi:hypothetical protein
MTAAAVKMVAVAELMAVAETMMAVMTAATMAAIAVAPATVTVAGGKDNGINSNGGGTDNNQLKAAAKTRWQW